MSDPILSPIPELALHWNPETRLIEIWNVLSNERIYTAWPDDPQRQLQKAVDHIEQCRECFFTTPYLDVHRSRLAIRKDFLATLSPIGNYEDVERVNVAYRITVARHEQVFNEVFPGDWTVPNMIRLTMPAPTPTQVPEEEPIELPF